MPRSWESNRRSVIALGMCHGLSGLSTYGLKGLGKGDEYPTYAPIASWHLYLYITFCF